MNQETIKEAREPNYLVSKLRNEVVNNEVFSAVMHKFALRQRARAQVTLHSLTQTMDKEGFKYTRADYVEVLKVLGGLGFGKLEYDSKKRLIALKNVNTTLQSIGKAAVGKGELKKVQFKNKFNTLTTMPLKRAISLEVKRDTVKAVSIRYQAELTVKFSKDETTTFPLPGGLSPKELGLLLSSQYAKVWK
jgi:hypothetical protein